MLRLIEQTPQRTVFEEKRTGLRIAAAVCLAACVLALAGITLQWRDAAEAFPERTSDLRVISGIGVFVLLIGLFAAASVYVLLLSRRMSLTLDRERGDIVLITPRGLRMASETLPYYGVKSVRLTGDDEMRVLALVFVLRDGRVIPITAGPTHARAEMEALAAQIRETLIGTAS